VAPAAAASGADLKAASAKLEADYAAATAAGASALPKAIETQQVWRVYVCDTTYVWDVMYSCVWYDLFMCVV